MKKLQYICVRYNKCKISQFLQTFSKVPQHVYEQNETIQKMLLKYGIASGFGNSHIDLVDSTRSQTKLIRKWLMMTALSERRHMSICKPPNIDITLLGELFKILFIHFVYDHFLTYTNKIKYFNPIF